MTTDIELTAVKKDVALPDFVSPAASFKDPSVSSEGALRNSRNVLETLRYYEAVLDRRLGVESSGPERVLPENRQPPKLWYIFVIWASSGTFGLGNFSIGTLGWSYGLSLGQTIPIMMFGILLGCMTAAWCGTLGPATGLRQISVSRYSMGWWPTKIVALFNIFGLIGFASVQCITAGQGLSAVSGYSLSILVGIVIVTVLALIIGFGGYRILLAIEAYFWMPFFILTLILFGETGNKVSLQQPATASGMAFTAAVLNLLASSYGCTSIFCSWISDYFVHYPADISRVKVYLLTMFGMWIANFIGVLPGCLIGSALAQDASLATAYNAHGIGEVMLRLMYPSGLAKFVMVIFSLGGIGFGAIAIYSAALAVQQLAAPLQMVPRFFWSLASFAGLVVLSIAGKTAVPTFLSNILALVGYFNTIYFAILFTEHALFRKGKITNYDLDGWNTQSRLPIGYAGFGAFVAGWLGCVLGMVASFYVGVIAEKIGGGDVANMLGLVFTLVSYPPLRHLELRFCGR
ncbi:hypothetical protein BO86DRAFT_372975 [Aspergillus japonicus CBS 114.51]|uniref:Nucleoside transporter n=1 Tax=Aspergillus japonicus CBS 114.51 TaxID=1448312 RepID=A0A8T8WLF6_ASPJA|nr:hypothetical protein BO86DRAFT_372975 [Aspergillus japonicus CBS 114.51]RAH76350.1 hypothetical protein BO86DRAFT_372975 [Aspergillus japonicus CBS 114.51]